MTPPIPPGWRDQLAAETRQAYWPKLLAFVAAERAAHTVFPPDDEVFSALALTAYADTKVLLLGQDPYHADGQAHGLAFSVPPGVAPPPSLRNIFKELHSDLGLPLPRTGYLAPWAAQGVLLLNAVLTVRAHHANSHHGRGWEQFTDAVLRALAARAQPVVFVLWGAYARRKAALLDPARHTVIASAHPSPLSAHQGFFGSHPFSQINAALIAHGEAALDWRLPGGEA
ncbi:MAG: uracil-DNA glycosylase [Anaerolineales bacterium]|nr:uracil-DNA glycosylase [Anaerolineales bacterium]